MNYRICVSLNGYATVEARNEDEARRKAMKLDESDFDFETFNDEVLEAAEVYEE